MQVVPQRNVITVIVRKEAKKRPEESLPNTDAEDERPLTHPEYLRFQRQVMSYLNALNSRVRVEGADPHYQLLAEFCKEREREED